MTDAGGVDVAAQAPPVSRNAKERTLVFIVVFLGFLIIAGLAAVVLRIIYLSANPPQTDSKAVSASPVASATVAPSGLALPAGANVKAISLSGDRLAVHYDAPSGAGIAVVDVATGRVLNRIDLTEEAAR